MHLKWGARCARRGLRVKLFGDDGPWEPVTLTIPWFTGASHAQMSEWSGLRRHRVGL